ncbi:MAG: class SAM-dependent methyltransferase [Candidatus Saccharibacteria bacterium]|nr:class SAM-dependent methyltransferase [Candidatus Saccharibacteria bacterium]
MAELVRVTIDTLVHGGQGLGTLDTGQKAFVWNALPGETVEARVIKRKRMYVEAIAEEIITASAERVAPEEANYLATSPWQMMTYEAENRYKKQITLDLFAHEKVRLPVVGDLVAGEQQWAYRNKMEYSFWGDDDGLHLALHQRGSSGKQIVAGSRLALPAIDAAANAICAQLQQLDIRAGDLKTIVVRCSQDGAAVVALFVKPTSFPELVLPGEAQGLRVYHSNPKSPASVATELLQETGDCNLHDVLLGQQFSYDVDSFFQVNIPVFELALSRIKEQLQAPVVTDMYAGVGSIGLSVASEGTTLVELDLPTATMAAVNAAASPLQTEVVETSAEQSLDYITTEVPVIVDPPRAGLHAKVVGRLLEAQPPQIVYLSCNPATQARDLVQLQAMYDCTFFEVYNFFPRTPHIECLAVLTLRA